MKKEIRAYLISLPAAIFIMMVFSCTTSPFFDLAYGDYYGNHSSTALLIGKEWLAGAIPYKDLFVTGGPLYYLIQAAGWEIAGRTGVWLLQSLWLSVGIYMIYRLCRAFTTERKSWLLTGAVVMINVTAGGAVYAGALLALFAVFYHKGVKQGLLSVICMAAGAAVVILPFVGWFTLNGAGREMFDGTFLYPVRMLFADMADHTLLMHKVVKSIPCLLLIVAGILACIRKKIENGLLFLLTGLGLSVFCILGDGDWQHYLIEVLCYPLLGICLFEYGRHGGIRKFLSVMCTVGMLVIMMIPLRHYAAFLLTEDISGYTQLMDEVKDYREKYTDNEIFMVDMPSFFYLYADITPRYRYFADRTDYEGVVDGIREDLNDYVQESCKATILIVKSRGMAYESIGNYEMADMYYHNRELMSVYEYME